MQVPGPQCPTVPLGGAECAMGVPPDGIEWHNICWQLRICRLSCHSATSSALLAHHSVTSSGAPVRWDAPGAVGEGGGTGRQRGGHGPLPMEDPLATRRASMTAEIAGTKARPRAAVPRLPGILGGPHQSVRSHHVARQKDLLGFLVSRLACALRYHGVAVVIDYGRLGVVQWY